MRKAIKKASKKQPSSVFVNGIKLPHTNLHLNNITPLTDNQQRAFDSFYQGRNMLLHGLAGTGKTFMSLYLGLDSVMKKSSLHSSVVIVGVS